MALCCNCLAGLVGATDCSFEARWIIRWHGADQRAGGESCTIVRWNRAIARVFVCAVALCVPFCQQLSMRCVGPSCTKESLITVRVSCLLVSDMSSCAQPVSLDTIHFMRCTRARDQPRLRFQDLVNTLSVRCRLPILPCKSTPTAQTMRTSPASPLKSCFKVFMLY